jgi:very-short-patch-repair endonuclease
MEEIYRLIIEFKTTHPLRFWTAIFIATSLILFVIWRLSKNKRKAKIEHLGTQITTSTVVEEKETIKPKLDAKKENPKFETPQTKVYTDTSDKVNLEVNETKSIYAKPTETKQEKVIPKVETVEVKPKAKTKSEEHLPKAKVETTKSKNEVDFVNYDITKVPTTNSYPVFRFPKKGTVVRSYRLGNTKRRGFKEESFQNSIERCFGKDFVVLGNVRLNTGKETRPFEPDIAIIDKSNSNLRIDIEIDEPYAGITRQPTHCKGEDVNRDIYFVDRGWIVIRFSEYQVHLQENDCLKFIAEAIKSAIPNYNIPTQLVNQTTLQVEKLWDIVQAQKWEKVKYREQYLNHIFQSIEEQTETIERDFDEQELKEEKLVKPTLIGEVDDKKSIAFNLKNKHPRDSRIKFYPEPHIYTIDNTPAPSASTIIAKFFPEFDPVEAIFKMKNGVAWGPEHKYWGKSDEELIKEWKDKGESSAIKGTFLHEQIENFYLEQAYEKTEEFHLFESFVSDHNHIIPYRTEWRIFDEQHHIAGTIDLISKNDNGYEMYDWKRSEKVVSKFNGEIIKNNKWQKGVGQLADIDDTSYNRYCLQQSLYKYILEKNYGLKVSKMYLIVLYPEYDRYYKVEVPYWQDKAEYILRTL